MWSPAALLCLSLLANCSIGAFGSWTHWSTYWTGQRNPSIQNKEDVKKTSGYDKPTPSSCPAIDCTKQCNRELGARITGSPIQYIDVPVPDAGGGPDYELKYCCKMCRNYPGGQCRYYTLIRFQWDEYEVEKSRCALYSSCVDNTGCVWYDNPMWMKEYGKAYYSGAICPRKGNDDPHFLAGTEPRFDVDGVPEESFALISDENLAVNVFLSGYYDKSALAETAARDGVKGAMRGWIRKLAVIWRSDIDRARHTLYIAARRGAEFGDGRGPGYLEVITLDGKSIETLEEPGDSFANVCGITIEMLPYQTEGSYSVDVYSIDIPGYISFSLRARAATAQYQLKDEAGRVLDSEVHLNIQIHDLQWTPSIHGIIGQTYRKDHSARSLTYEEKVKALHIPIQADGETGKGYLDGTMIDYELSSIFSTKWGFSAFKEDEAWENMQ